MISQMNAVQNAARLAMADHRAAEPLLLRRRSQSGGFRYGLLLIPVVMAGLAIFAVFPSG